MTLDGLRLTLRLARFELLAFGAILIGLIVALAIAMPWLDTMRPPAACFEQTDQLLPGCGSELNSWYSVKAATTGLLGGLLVAVSFAAGLFLGAPLIARELERGTTRLVWALGPSRWRWYATRLLPILFLVFAMTYAAGVSLDRLAAWSTPEVDVSKAFADFGSRGLLIAARSTFIFGVGVAVGSVLGRSLPAVIVTAVICVVGLTGGEQVHQRMLRGEAVAIPEERATPGDLYVDQRFRLPDGSLVGYEYFNGAEPFDDEGMPKYPIVALVVPGERYRFAETREALVLGGGALAGMLVAGVVVGRRRPD
jgi:hypothetical protein